MKNPGRVLLIFMHSICMVIVLFTKSSKEAIRLYDFGKVSLVPTTTSAAVMTTKARSKLECLVLCAKHSSCIQSSFNKTSLICNGYDRKQNMTGSPTTTSFEISCKTPGYARRSGSALCIKIILDHNITNWDDVYNKCQMDGTNIFPVDVSLQHEYLYFQHYLHSEYNPYPGTVFSGTAVGIQRSAVTTPWIGLITSNTLDTSLSWSAVVDNNYGLCLCYWKWNGSLILDDISCGHQHNPGTLQPVICQEVNKIPT